MGDWADAIKNQTSPKTQMLICVLQGAKGKGVIYKELKKFLITEIPIPSQVILTSTINKRKYIY
jgi:hypothetical protein